MMRNKEPKGINAFNIRQARPTANKANNKIKKIPLFVLYYNVEILSVIPGYHSEQKHLHVIS